MLEENPVEAKSPPLPPRPVKSNRSTAIPSCESALATWRAAAISLEHVKQCANRAKALILPDGRSSRAARLASCAPSNSSFSGCCPILLPPCGHSATGKHTCPSCKSRIGVNTVTADLERYAAGETENERPEVSVSLVQQRLQPALLFRGQLGSGDIVGSSAIASTLAQGCNNSNQPAIRATGPAAHRTIVCQAKRGFSSTNSP